MGGEEERREDGREGRLFSLLLFLFARSRDCCHLSVFLSRQIAREGDARQPSW